MADSTGLIPAEVDKGLDLSSHSTIPDRFFKCPYLCCACTACNLEGGCMGCKGNSQLLCWEEDGFCFKCVGHDRSCCTCFSGTCELVSCNTFCKCYRQCFCLEIICGCPLDKAYRDTEVAFQQVPTKVDPESNKDARPCFGCCCEVASCYTKFPGCLSCYTKSSCCCLETEGTCCKPYCCVKKEKQSLMCLCNKVNCLMVWPGVLCKGIMQTCCLDQRCAIPCDNDVPCLFMPLPCFTMIANYSIHCDFCATLGDLQAVGKQPPAQV